ncbi:aminoglycoside phosphotransferase family protein [Paenibacillus gansuensis]|uniref:Aminoglycoside phosphotransferase family protein n=1 Tax=Paenibacillus gansuensis TaxID=306542 RepID=A0ABW5P9J8_9BACL
MVIPEKFQSKIIGAFGEEGRRWLETLDDRLRRYAERWELQIGEPYANLSYNYVVKAVDSTGELVVLKLGVPNFDTRNEIHTLETYQGEGCVRLLKSDPAEGVFLLERLSPGTMLKELGEDAALEQAMNVWKALRRPVPAGFRGPSIMDWARGLEQYEQRYISGEMPIPAEAVETARDLFRELTETSEGAELLHGDLHHQNILYSEQRGWIAIDPKGVAGDPYFGLITFLHNELHHNTNPKQLLRRRIEGLCSGLRLDKTRLLQAAFSLTVLYACWAAEDQDSFMKETYRCAEWYGEWLREEEIVS